jgi:hypothetical protein
MSDAPSYLVAFPGQSVGQGAVKFIFTNSTFLVAHSHQDGVIPVPSPGDLLAIFAIKEKYTPPPSGDFIYDEVICNLIVANDGYTYALIPNDISTFHNRLNYFLSNWQKIQLKFERDCSAIGEWDSGKSREWIALLLRTLNSPTNNFNVSAYRTQTNNGLYGRKWYKLIPDTPDESIVKEEPCN